MIAVSAACNKIKARFRFFPASHFTSKVWPFFLAPRTASKVFKSLGGFSFVILAAKWSNLFGVIFDRTIWVDHVLQTRDRRAALFLLLLANVPLISRPVDVPESSANERRNLGKGKEEEERRAGKC